MRRTQYGVLQNAKRLVVALVLATGSMAAAEPTAPAATAPTRQIPVLFHLAQGMAKSDAFITGQLLYANQIYAALGLELVDAGHVLIPTRHARMLTREDRDSVAPFVHGKVVHCFVVETLMDVEARPRARERRVDEAGRERRGVHWHVSAAVPTHFVIVSKISGPYVLAHELGHFFGNREHSETAGNLMSYTPGSGPPFLDEAQRARVQKTLARMLRSGELEPAKTAR